MEDDLKNCTSQLLPELGALNSSEMLDALSVMLSSQGDRATLKIMLQDCLYPNNSHPYFLPWWQKTIWTLLFGAMLLVSTTGNTTVIWIVLGDKMNACKRSESNESGYNIASSSGGHSCSSAISLKREFSSYALETIADWGDSLAKQLLTSNSLINEFQSENTNLESKPVANETKKASWSCSLETPCSLDELQDSFTSCLSSIASRIVFAKDDDEIVEYKNERFTYLPSEQDDLSNCSWSSFYAPPDGAPSDREITTDLDNLILTSNEPTLGGLESEEPTHISKAMSKDGYK